MAYAKKRKTSSNFGLKKPRTPTSAYVYTATAKNIILFVIIAAIITVIITTICAFLFKPERQIQAKFDHIASKYYEEVFYEGMINSDSFSGDPETALQKYEKTGIAPITLRQFILSDDEEFIADATYLQKYCDENETSITFFPEPPYSKTSYRTEITYSCNF